MILSSEGIAGLDQRFRTNLINSITGFKSVALVGTKSLANQTNLAILSQIIHVGANPPLIGILFRPDVVPRHTYSNILASKVFTINHIHSSFVKKAHHTAARWEESEFNACGLTEEWVDGFGAPFVNESHIQIACELVENLDVKANGTHFVVGKILSIKVPDEVILEDGFVDLEAAGTLTCSGLDSYHQTSKIARFTYAKPGHEPKEL
ncbi:flavin reductase family protein [Marinoscillum sp.]|uniref:flavin reductase family protein n=1 Tax=Marinoscillum sp. TaxID=2024838 RepID=UPI003BA947A9